MPSELPLACVAGRTGDFEFFAESLGRSVSIHDGADSTFIVLTRIGEPARLFECQDKEEAVRLWEQTQRQWAKEV